MSAYVVPIHDDGGAYIGKAYVHDDGTVRGELLAGAVTTDLWHLSIVHTPAPAIPYCGYPTCALGHRLLPTEGTAGPRLRNAVAFAREEHLTLRGHVIGIGRPPVTAYEARRATHVAPIPPAPPEAPKPAQHPGDAALTAHITQVMDPNPWRDFDWTAYIDYLNWRMYQAAYPFRPHPPMPVTRNS